MRMGGASTFNIVAGLVAAFALVLGGLAPAGAAPESVASPVTAATSLVALPTVARPASMTAVGPDITAGPNATTLAETPDGNTAYVVFNTDAKAIAVIDLNTGQRVATIAMTVYIQGLKASPDGSRIYFTSPSLRGVGIISTATNSVTGIIDLGVTGNFIVAPSPDGQVLLALDGFLRVIHVIDANTLVQRSTISLASENEVDGVWVSPDSSQAYVGVGNDDFALRHRVFTVKVLDLPTAQLVRTIPSCNYIRDLVFAAGLHKVYIGCEQYRVTVADMVTGSVLQDLPVDFKVRFLALAAGGSKVLAAGNEDPGVTEIDVATDTVSVGVSIPGLIFGLAAARQGSQAYVLQDGKTGQSVLSVLTVTNSKPSVTTDRVFGADRYETAVEVAKVHYPWTNTVYIASGEQFADALSAAPAAAHEGAALLLTKTNVLPDVVRNAITSLNTTKIVVVGGTGAVSASVFAQLKAMVPNTIRRSGADRYATSRAVIAGAFTYAYYVYVATGEDYPDALSAGAVAAQNGAPVLLVRGNAQTLDSQTKALLVRMQTNNTPIIGGTGVVSRGIENALAASLLGPERVAGADRFATNRAVNRRFAYGERTFYVSGYAFPDALAIASVASARTGIVYLVHSTCIPAGDLQDIAGTPAATRITLIGGPAVVGNDVAFGKAC